MTYRNSGYLSGFSIASPALTIETPHISFSISNPLYSSPVGVITVFSLMMRDSFPDDYL